jgi:hypothetical protein
MATGTVHLYANFLLHLAQAGANWASDTLKCTLHTSSYTPNYLTHAHQSDLTNELAASGNYSTGGVTLTGVSASLVAANSLTAWAANTAYVVGQVRRPTTGNAHVYICVVAGTSHATTEPTWPTTNGATVTDGTVTWAEAGTAVLKLLGAIPTWANATFVTRYAVVADTTPGTAATNPLAACIDFGSDLSPSAGNFAITVDSDGLLTIPIRA